MSCTDEAEVRFGFGCAPLVLGECVQGRLDDGLDFLITAPLALHSRARFQPGNADGRVEVRPATCTKSQHAVKQWLHERGLPERGRLELHTPLPASHGFGTSSADITASLRAVADAYGQTVTPEEISRIAISIEPTDGSMYADAVAYAHRQGRLLERLGTSPGFVALTICDKNGIDTLEFDRRRGAGFAYDAWEIRDLRRAWEMVREANRSGSLALLGQACLISARINERFLPKPHFAEMHQLVEEGLGEGLITAHSGTALALLLDPNRPDHQEQCEEAMLRLDRISDKNCLRLSNRAAPRGKEPSPSPLLLCPTGL